MKFTSRFSSLKFYVNGTMKSFSNGEFTTEDKDEIAVLDTIKDAIKVEANVEVKVAVKDEIKPDNDVKSTSKSKPKTTKPEGK